MEKHETKTRNHILCFFSSHVLPFFHSFLPFLLCCFLPSFLPPSLPSFLHFFIPSFLPSSSFLHSFLHFFIPSFISSFLLRLLFICLILWSTLINPYLPCVAHKPPWILCVSICCHELHQAAAELARGRRNDPVTRMV